MLRLRRKVGESLLIGDNIKITILEGSGSEEGLIHIGISAPREIPVHREEIRKKMRSNGRLDSQD